MNNKDFIAALASVNGITRKEAQEMVNALLDDFVEAVDDETMLHVPNFGTFEVKKKLERLVVSPLSKQRKLIPPKLALAFRPATQLREKIK